MDKEQLVEARRALAYTGMLGHTIAVVEKHHRHGCDYCVRAECPDIARAIRTIAEDTTGAHFTIFEKIGKKWYLCNSKLVKQGKPV